MLQFTHAEPCSLLQPHNVLTAHVLHYDTVFMSDYDNICWNRFVCVLAGQGRCHSADSCSFINTVLCFLANSHECGHSAEDPMRVKAEEVEECACVLTG